eukprot:11858812-Ditylum_brightwellii.AAC.1
MALILLLLRSPRDSMLTNPFSDVAGVPPSFVDVSPSFAGLVMCAPSPSYHEVAMRKASSVARSECSATRVAQLGGVSADVR